MQDARISTNVTLGSFVFMNTGSKVCHDGKLGNYVTLSPDVTLAGNVVVGDNTEIGMGANVIQGITIGTNTVIGAGSVVVRDVEDHCKAAGVPAKAYRKNNPFDNYTPQEVSSKYGYNNYNLPRIK